MDTYVSLGIENGRPVCYGMFRTLGDALGFELEYNSAKIIYNKEGDYYTVCFEDLTITYIVKADS